MDHHLILFNIYIFSKQLIPKFNNYNKHLNSFLKATSAAAIPIIKKYFNINFFYNRLIHSIVQKDITENYIPSLHSTYQNGAEN